MADINQLLADDQLHTNQGAASIWQLFKYAKGMHGQFILALSLIFLGSVMVMVSAHYLGVFAEVLAGGIRLSKIIYLATAITTLEILALMGRYYGRLFLSRAMNQVSLQIRLKLFEKIKKLPLSYFDSQPLGRTLTRMTHDVEGIEQFFGGTLAHLITAMITIVVVVIAMLATDISFGAVVILSSLPAIISSFSFRSRLIYWLRLSKKWHSITTSKIAEYLNGITSIKIFSLEDWSQKELDTALNEYYKAQINTMTWNSVIRPTAVWFSSLPLLLIMSYGGYLVLGNHLSLAVFVAFIRYSERFLHPIMTIMQEIQVVQEAITSSERVSQMLIESEENQVLGPDGKYSGALKGSIEFENVCFEYESSKNVLKNVSFKIFPGMKVALVGATGSGKSSILNLISGLYRHSSGRIMVDGIEINEWSRQSLRSQIGVVAQEVMIFRGSLRDNLSVASENRNLGDDVILEVCQQVGLMKLIQKMPKGLDSWILDAGENLSHGERQLIAIARMLLKNPRLLILDEATSSIDVESEKLVHDAVSLLMKNRTCIAVAHRLSTVINSDLILTLDQGQIVETGTHLDLMELKKSYYKLAQRQLS